MIRYYQNLLVVSRLRKHCNTAMIFTIDRRYLALILYLSHGFLTDMQNGQVMLYLGADCSQTGSTITPLLVTTVSSGRVAHAAAH